MNTKIQLSPEEIELVTGTQWILTKHVIIKKVFQMFGVINEVFKEEAEPYYYLFPENIKHQNGKISRGENYQLLPYAILDYPSFFWKHRIFAIRTMFWWGNFFSVTLHLSGEHKEKYVSNSNDIFHFLKENNFFICINEDEWQHNFEAGNYIAASSIDLAQFKEINNKPFFKIAKKLSLAEWDNANEFFLKTFKEIIQLLQINYPNGKKGLLPASPKVDFGL